ncbi:unnamed protein product [Linum tenue]|uniref:Uncharacterized protein n=1 Tax=Linum tenue TaxID=586396 RepID=A0AAV0PFU9_9ROSI|nr:unnamed protein product [Linum tenue]
MEDDKWSIGTSTTSSRAYQQDSKFLSESLEDTDDHLLADFPCPYCEEDYDLVELCCHIDDEHPYEPKSEMCPVCGLTDAMDMVAHITSQHGDMAHSLQKLKRRKGDLRSSLSSLKREAEDDYLQSLFSRSSAAVLPPTDPLLSFLHHVPSLDKADSAQSFLSTEVDAGKQQPVDIKTERCSVSSPPLSDKEHTEKTQRSQFVQGLLLSTMLDDDS